MKNNTITAPEESLLTLNQRIYVERYNDNGIMVIGDNFTWDDEHVRIYKKKELVAVFREEDIHYVILN